MDAAMEPQKKGLSEIDGRVSQGLSEDDGKVVILKIMHNIIEKLISQGGDFNFAQIESGRSIRIGWKLNNQSRKVLLYWLPEMDDLMPNVLLIVFDVDRQDYDIYDDRIFENSDEEIAKVLKRASKFMLL